MSASPVRYARWADPRDAIDRRIFNNMLTRFKQNEAVLKRNWTEDQSNVFFLFENNQLTGCMTHNADGDDNVFLYDRPELGGQYAQALRLTYEPHWTDAKHNALSLKEIDLETAKKEFSDKIAVINASKKARVFRLLHWTDSVGVVVYETNSEPAVYLDDKSISNFEILKLVDIATHSRPRYTSKPRKPIEKPFDPREDYVNKEIARRMAWNNKTDEYDMPYKQTEDTPKLRKELGEEYDSREKSEYDYMRRLGLTKKEQYKDAKLRDDLEEQMRMERQYNTTI